MEGRTLRSRTRVRAQLNLALHVVSLYIAQTSGDGRHSQVLTPSIGWCDVEPGEAWGPTLDVEPEALQELVDDLWRMGIRPTEGKVSDRTLQAQEEHIKSLREVSAHLLELAKFRT